MQRTPTLSPFAGRGQSRRKAVPGDARRHNRSLVLRTLFQSGPVSRADLARATHLTRVTTSDLAAELLADGLVEELGTRTDQGVGKPAILLGIVPDSRLTITLDLSDEEAFSAALVDLAGTIRDRRTAKRDGRTGDQAIELAAKLASEVASSAGGRLLGMGSGQPNRVKSVEIAMEKAGDEVAGAALASDAFFPFAWGDAVEMACKAGVSAIIHPGGSLRDQDGIDCCNQYGVVLVFTGVRHFQH